LARLRAARAPCQGAHWLVSVLCTAPCPWGTRITAETARISADTPLRRAPNTETVPYTPKIMTFGNGVRRSPGARSLHSHGEISGDPRSIRADLRSPMTRSRTTHGDEPRRSTELSQRRETSQCKTAEAIRELKTAAVPRTTAVSSAIGLASISSRRRYTPICVNHELREARYRRSRARRSHSRPEP